MEQAVGLQALRLALAFVLGVALGITYDLVRPLRRRSGRVGAAVLDLLFSFASGAAAFSFAMGAGSGRMGVWELAAAFVGFSGYMHTLSDVVFTVTDGFFRTVLRACVSIVKIIKKFAQTTKFLFQKARK